MFLCDLFPHSFKSLRQALDIPERPGPNMLSQCLSYDSDLCLEMTSEPYSLSEAQMRHAVDRYRLGKSRSGKTIYWMIDDLGIVRDGHIGTSWVSQMLKHRSPALAPYLLTDHCLFGLHLLCHTDNTDITDSNKISASPIKKSVSSVQSVCKNKPICVVESERSAVILSEIYPQSLWLAFAYLSNTNERLLSPLQGHRVILFPNADETKETYLAYLEIADQARRRYHLDVIVHPLLVDSTSPSQKSRHIDLLTYYLESIRSP